MNLLSRRTTSLAGGHKLLVHEPPPDEAQPPLAGLALGEHAFQQPRPGLVAQLQQVLLVQLGFLIVLWLGVDGVEGETSLTRNREPGNGQRVHLSGALSLVLALGQALQALRDVKRRVDEGPVAVPLHFISTEENIRLEVLQCLVYHVRLLPYRDGGGARALGAEGEER